MIFNRRWKVEHWNQVARSDIFIGYADDVREYKVYDSCDRKKIISRLAKFDEDTKGSMLLKGRKKSHFISL